MAVTVDSTGTDAFYNIFVPGTLIFGPTAGVSGTAGSNTTGITTTSSATAIVLIFCWECTTVAVGPGTVTAVWDPNGANQAFSVVATGTSENGSNVHTLQTLILGLASPSSFGNKPITLTFGTGTASDGPYIDAIAFSGTHLTNPFRNGVGAGEAGAGGTQNPTITITSPSGDISVAACSFDFQTMTNLSGTAFSPSFNDISGPLGGAFAHQTAGVGSTTFSATADLNDGWSYAAVSIQPPAGAPPVVSVPLGILGFVENEW